MENADPKDGAALHAVAVELQKRFCPELGSKPKEKTVEKKASSKDATKSDLPTIVNAPLDFELKGLNREHPYLLNRGFSQDTIEHFGLGFAPLVCAVHSGNKSLHGWFYVHGQPAAKVEKFFRHAVSLGADHATWTRCQFVRMPNGTRDNGKRQTVYFTNFKSMEAAL